MRATTLLVIITMMALQLLHAQDAPVDTSMKRTRLTEVLALAGGAVYGTDFLSMQEIAAFTPESAILAQARGERYWEDGNSTMIGFSALFVFDRLKKDGSRGPFQWRVGTDYYRRTHRMTDIRFNEHYLIDSLLSLETGSVALIDSIHTDRIGVKQLRDELAIHFSLISKTNSNKRARIYGGFGGMIGVNLRSSTQVDFSSRYRYSEFSYSSLIGEDPFGFSEVDNEFFVNKAGALNIQGFFVLGLDIGLAAKHEVWRKLRWTWESRPGIQFYDVAEHKAVTTTFWAMHFGFSFALGESRSQQAIEKPPLY